MLEQVLTIVMNFMTFLGIATVRNATVNSQRWTQNSKIYVWNDMFDPNHNARNNYYYVETSIANSWLGLPQDVIIMNWYLKSRDVS